MQGVSHHEAVSTLRQAGSWIKMKVLRTQRLEPAENRATEEPEDSDTGFGQKETESNCSSIAKRIEAVVCNGKGLVCANLENRWLKT